MFYIANQFKAKLRAEIAQMNENLSKSPTITPQLSFYELRRLRRNMRNLIDSSSSSWSLFASAEDHFVQEFFKSIIVNFETEVEVLFKDPKSKDLSDLSRAANGSNGSGETPGAFKFDQFQALDGEIEDFVKNVKFQTFGSSKMNLALKKAKKGLNGAPDDTADSSVLSQSRSDEISEFLTEMMTDGQKNLFESIEELKNDELWELHGENKGCPEEIFIKQFLSENPEIEERRLQRLKRLKNRLKDVRVVKCQTLVRNDGIVAKCLITDNGDKLLVRNVNGTINIASEALSSNW